jgi:hypothetical protein
VVNISAEDFLNQLKTADEEKRKQIKKNTRIQYIIYHTTLRGGYVQTHCPVYGIKL